jgi:predicted nuclease of predicted toxin-antitoxin system
VKLLLDQGLPRSAAQRLLATGMDAVHAGESGLASASDEDVLNFARGEGRVVVTLDADFHALLAMSGAHGPSVIRIRLEGLRGEALAALLQATLERCAEDLSAGALVTVTESRIRVRHLPIESRQR